jgi:F-type H+-transporting ATPase subunit b
MEAFIKSIDDIRLSLGIDITSVYQLVIFLTAYIVLSELIFKPYLAAYIEREKRTVGGQEEANSILARSQQVQAEYEKRAKAINHEIKVIVDGARSEALKSQEHSLKIAQSNFEQKSSEIHKAVQSKLKTALTTMEGEVSEVSRMIVNKLIGKNA